MSQKEKWRKAVVEEFHLKTDMAVKHQENHIIGYPHDEPTKLARTALVIMIAPMMGAPALACRLIPVYSF